MDSRSSDVLERLHRAVHVALEDDPELLDLARLDLLVEVGQGHPGATVTFFSRSWRRRAIWRALRSSSTAAQGVAGRRHARQAQHLDRVDRAGLLHPLAPVVEHRPDLAVVLADHHDVPLVQGALLDQHGGHRAPAAVELGLDHHALGAARFGLALSSMISAWSAVISRSCSTPVPFLAEVFTKMVWPPHSSGTSPWFDSSCLTRSGFGVGLVHLVDRHDDRHVRRPWRG